MLEADCGAFGKCSACKGVMPSTGPHRRAKNFLGTSRHEQTESPGKTLSWSATDNEHGKRGLAFAVANVRGQGQGLRAHHPTAVLAFAARYKSRLLVFVLFSVLSAVLAVITPVLAGRIVDEIVAQSSIRTILTIALVIAVVAVLDAVVSVVVRWFSSRLGEGIIYDLRTAVFDHVQKMPVAFFARTRTGALVSRLNNDVIGAQAAFAGTLSGLVSNSVALVLTAGVMLSTSWQVTLVAWCCCRSSCCRPAAMENPWPCCARNPPN